MLIGGCAAAVADLVCGPMVQLIECKWTNTQTDLHTDTTENITSSDNGLQYKRTSHAKVDDATKKEWTN